MNEYRLPLISVDSVLSCAPLYVCADAWGPTATPTHNATHDSRIVSVLIAFRLAPLGIESLPAYTNQTKRTRPRIFQIAHSTPSNGRVGNYVQRTPCCCVKNHKNIIRKNTYLLGYWDCLLQLRHLLLSLNRNKSIINHWIVPGLRVNKQGTNLPLGQERPILNLLLCKQSMKNTGYLVIGAKIRHYFVISEKSDWITHVTVMLGCSFITTR